MNRDSNATAFMQQIADDHTLTHSALTVADIMADTITGYRPVAAINWRTVWKTSGLLRGETLDAINELNHAAHIGQPQSGWEQTPGYPVRLHAGAVTA